MGKSPEKYEDIVEDVVGGMGKAIKRTFLVLGIIIVGLILVLIFT